jgi:hypothetical protein
MSGGHFQSPMPATATATGGHQGHIRACCFRYAISLEDMQGSAEISELTEESRALRDSLSSGG